MGEDVVETLNKIFIALNENGIENLVSGTFQHNVVSQECFFIISNIPSIIIAYGLCRSKEEAIQTKPIESERIYQKIKKCLQEKKVFVDKIEEMGSRYGLSRLGFGFVTVSTKSRYIWEEEF